MPIGAAQAADEISSNVRAVIDRVLEADLPAQAVDAAQQTARDARRWPRRAWSDWVRPAVGNVWKRRSVALGAAGAAVPASRELVDAAAIRLGLKRREERHWGVFFLGLLLGMIGGALIAILTAPKPGREIRNELAARAREAGDWVPVFQRPEGSSGAHAEQQELGATAESGPAGAGPFEDATSYAASTGSMESAEPMEPLSPPVGGSIPPAAAEGESPGEPDR